MLDSLPDLPLTGVGIGSVLTAVAYAILTGRLVPRATLKDVRDDRDARLAEIGKEADHWRAACEAQTEINRVYSEQIRDLVAVARTTNDLIRSIPGPVSKGPPG